MGKKFGIPKSLEFRLFSQIIFRYFRTTIKNNNNKPMMTKEMKLDFCRMAFLFDEKQTASPEILSSKIANKTLYF